MPKPLQEYDGWDPPRYLYRFSMIGDLLSFPVYTSNLAIIYGSEFINQKDLWAADPAQIKSLQFDLLDETGDLGSNSII